jgi:DNA-binding protein HU-beta
LVVERTRIMNHTQLIEAVAKESGESEKIVAKVLRATFDVIGRTVIEKGRVTVTNFGTWYASEVAPRVRRDPQSGEEWMAPRTYYPRFRWSPRVRDAVVTGDVLPTLKKRGQGQA